MTLDSWLQYRLVRRSVFVIVTLLPIFVLMDAIVLPIMEGFTNRNAEIARQTDMLARLKGIANYEPPAATGDGTANEAGNYLIGQNEGLASAKLQIRLKSFAQANRTQLRLIQGLPPETDGSLRLIGARLHISGPIQTIHKTISAIETARPYLVIRSATLKPVRQIRNVGNRPTEPVIEAQLEVFGAFREGTPQ